MPAALAHLAVSSPPRPERDALGDVSGHISAWLQTLSATEGEDGEDDSFRENGTHHRGMGLSLLDRRRTFA